MKKDFKTIKNLILLIASALTLVAVTFAWYSISKNVGGFTINSNVSGSTIAVNYFESTDNGSTYKELKGDLDMNEMIDGKIAKYRMDIKTFNDFLVKIVMSFEGLTGSNAAADHVYFNYRLETKDGDVLSHGENLKMSDYASNSVFAQDVSLYQKNGTNDFKLYYELYLVTNGDDISGKASLGEVKLAGQQIS